MSSTCGYLVYLQSFFGNAYMYTNKKIYTNFDQKYIQKTTKNN